MTPPRKVPAELLDHDRKQRTTHDMMDALREQVDRMTGGRTSILYHASYYRGLTTVLTKGIDDIKSLVGFALLELMLLAAMMHLHLSNPGAVSTIWLAIVGAITVYFLMRLNITLKGLARLAKGHPEIMPQEPVTFPRGDTWNE